MFRGLFDRLKIMPEMIVSRNSTPAVTNLLVVESMLNFPKIQVFIGKLSASGLT
jgi:hypothetical protein